MSMGVYKIDPLRLKTGNGSSKLLREDGTWVSAGSGSVTSMSIVTANGVSGSVATATTTPAVTITLAAITPTTVVASGTMRTSGGDLLVVDSAKGLVLKDTQGTPHFWRLSVSTLGVLTTTDIGTSAPS